MSKIAVVTDSTATIPEELVKKYNIYVAPMGIIWDREKYRDGIDLKRDEFYKRLRSSLTLPTTSGAIQGEFLQIFENLRGKVDGVVVVTIASAFSAVYSSAINAKEMVSEMPIEIVDSMQATASEGLVALAAAKTAAVGSDIQEVAQKAKDISKKVQCLLAMDTLEYLRRGGRVNYPSAIFARLLRVKPILSIEDGKLIPVKKPITRKKQLETLLNLIGERVTKTPLHVAINDADFREGAENLKKLIADKFKPVEILMSEMPPVVGIHVGPDALCVGFYNE